MILVADKLLSTWCAQIPNHIALSFSDNTVSNNTVSWKQLDNAIHHVSQQLKDQGIDEGHIIAAISKNSMELLLLYLACMRLGAVAALIAPAPLSQLQEKLSSLNCFNIWLGAEMEHLASHRCIETDYKRLTIDTIYSFSPCEPVKQGKHPLNIASIVFTSGSSGAAKAVAHSANQHIASAQGLVEKLPFEKTDTWLLSLPMYHVSGLAIIWRWLTVGGCLKIAVGKDLHTDLEGVTHASLVPTQLKRLFESGKALSLTRVLLGGSHIPLALAEEANRRGIDTWLGYGMTEMASTVMAKRANGQLGVGFLLPKRKLKLEGERIYVGGETLALGYICQGKLTPLTKDGWFDSKDLGEWHGNELRIRGRADNQFISGGENIYCEEIELILQQHPKIKTAFIIPVKDNEFGARPVAVVSSDTAIDSTSYGQYLFNKLEKFKWPIDYFLMPESMTERGGIKISRAQVKAWFMQIQSKYTPQFQRASERF